MTIDDLLAIKSVSDPQISPDGKSVVYVVSELDRATDKTNSDLWLVPAAGGEPKRLTTAEGTDNHPRWRPDGKEIAFVSSRGGSSQVWLLPIDGGEARPADEAADRRLGADLVAQGGSDRLRRRGLSGEEPRGDRRPRQGEGGVQEQGPHLRPADDPPLEHLGRGEAEPPVRRRRQDRRGEGPDAQARGQHPPRPVRRLVGLRLLSRRQGARLHRRADPRHRPGPPTPTSGPSPSTGASRRTCPRTIPAPTPSRPTRPTASRSPG